MEPVSQSNSSCSVCDSAIETMACEDPCTKKLCQLFIYQKAISEKYEEKIHWIWVLNKVSEVLCCTDAAKNYNDLKETIRRSKKCERWDFLTKICNIESNTGFWSQYGGFLAVFGRLAFRVVRRLYETSFSFWAVHMRRAVEEERYNSKQYAEQLHLRLLECHYTIQNNKKRGFQEMRRESGDKRYIPIEEETSSLLKQNVAIPMELLQLVDDLKIDVTEKRDDHGCGLCACNQVPEEGLQTTPVDLNGKNVVKNGIQFSDDFQSSVRERLIEQFPTLLDAQFCSPNVMEGKSRKNSTSNGKRENSKRSLTAQQNVETVGENQQVEDAMNEEQVRNTPVDVSVDEQVSSGTSRSFICGGTDTNIACEIPEGKQPVNEMEIKVESSQKVAQAFLDFADKKSLKPVVILAEYKYENCLKYVKDAAGPRGSITEQKGDFDLIVIIPQMGIFLGQLKDIEDDSSNFKRRICEASSQCKKDISVFIEIFRDNITMFDLPIFEFIASPLVSRRTLDECCSFTQCALYNIILTQDDLKDEACFEAWLQERLGGAMNISDDWIIRVEDYWTLLERFVGCGSEAVIYPYPKLIGDYCFQSPLTDEQMYFVNNEDKKFEKLMLAGDYAVGKSHILVKKSLKIAREIKSDRERNGKVFIIACSDICVDGEFLDPQFPDHTVHHLQKFCKGEYEDIISVEKFSSFTQAESTDLSGSKGVDLFMKTISQKQRTGHELHLMFDEVPAKFVEKLQNYQQTFAECLRFVETFWIVIATNSYRVRCDESGTLRIEDCKPSSNFHNVYLSKVVRSPRLVFELSQKVSECCGDDHQGSLINSYKGSRPLLFRVPRCKCPEGTHINGASGHQVELNPVTYSCMEDRLSSTLRAVFCEIGILKADEIVSEWPGKVTMLVFGVEDDSLFNDLNTLLIKCCKNFKGLSVRNTLKVGWKHRKENVHADRGTPTAPEGESCSSINFNSDNGLDSFGITQPAVAVGDSGGNSEVNEGNWASGQGTYQEYQYVDVGKCRDSSSDSNGSGRDDLGLSDMFSSPDIHEREYSGGNVCEDGNDSQGHDYKENTQIDNVQSGPQMLLTRATYFVGCESHVVICIDLNAMKHWFKNTKVAYSTLAVSRCLSQYIHLTWHDEEAEVMYKMNVEALSEDLDGNDQENVREANMHSMLEKLLEEGVIEEKAVLLN